MKARPNAPSMGRVTEICVCRVAESRLSWEGIDHWSGVESGPNIRLTARLLCRQNYTVSSGRSGAIQIGTGYLGNLVWPTLDQVLKI